MRLAKLKLCLGQAGVPWNAGPTFAVCAGCRWATGLSIVAMLRTDLPLRERFMCMLYLLRLAVRMRGHLWNDLVVAGHVAALRMRKPGRVEASASD
jgi:hypothetical protein